MASYKLASWQVRLHEIIYESNTRAGKIFDITLLVLIVSSILVVMLDSMQDLHAQFGTLFLVLEWFFTLLFTIEYMLRLICIKKPLGYVFSFLGMIDLLTIIPGYLSFFYAGSQSLMVLRGLRLLRVFRIFKLTRYVSEMQFLIVALKGSMRKISVFMFFVFALVVILGSIMYTAEHGQNGFNSIPDSIYWAIVTITTVGYGDITPATPAGKLVASAIMLIGYAIIAVPTGIITTEMALSARHMKQQSRTCRGCGREGHDADAEFCKYCGGKL